MARRPGASDKCGIKPGWPRAAAAAGRPFQAARPLDDAAGPDQLRSSSRHLDGHRGPAPLEPAAGVSRPCWDLRRRVSLRLEPGTGTVRLGAGSLAAT
jgi:hypothetical protein